MKAHIRACLQLDDANSIAAKNDLAKGGLTKADNARKISSARVESVDYPFSMLSVKERRSRIRLEQESKCAVCSIPESWNGKPLKFELDHIDGDRTNEIRQNLRLICPNCHSQTPTYKIGNVKTPGVKRYSDEDVIEALKQNVSAYKAMVSLGMNPHGGNYQRLRRLVKNYNLTLPYSF